MALVYDNTKPASKGGGYIEWNGPLDNSPGGWLTEYENRRQKAAADLARSQGRWNTVKKLAFGAVAAPFAAAAAPAIFGATAAGTGAATAGTAAASAAPTAAAAGGGMTLGNIWNLANLGVGGVTSLLGMRSSNNAANQQIALARQQMTMQQQADAEARAEAKRQFDAQQANEAKRIASEDADRAYTRQQSDYQMQLLRDREARLAPYRAQADRARQRLAAFLGLG